MVEGAIGNCWEMGLQAPNREERRVRSLARAGEKGGAASREGDRGSDQGGDVEGWRPLSQPLREEKKSSPGWREPKPGSLEPDT